ncbi:hypothetical protein LT679_06515 [Mucilaginibacter roseus]|uniref:Lipocalin-like domain-containing protein n=1 Tax=Mucilaginibacter roseus TaxID=1528868 RepID=A0ABS8U3V9_9SPHI|nr:hypothetical protein [Mucilaginibacter roseus]MCD8740251.1 hypothetical protein [Mucilaginibacter roseus]
MKKRLHFAFALILAVILVACSKKDKEVIDCSTLAGQWAPPRILLKFTDKTTGENLILTKNIVDADVTVTDKQTGNPVKNWRIANPETTDPISNGTIGFSVILEEAGVFNYEVAIKNVGSAVLSYTVTKEKGSTCIPFYYRVSKMEITDREYSALVVDGKEINNFLVVKL